MENKEELNPKAEQSEASKGEEHMANERAGLTDNNDDVKPIAISDHGTNIKNSQKEEPQNKGVDEKPEDKESTTEVKQASQPEPEKPAAEDITAQEEPAEKSDEEVKKAETPDESEQEPQETPEKDVVEEPQAESVGDDKAETFVTAELQQASQPELEKPAAADDGAKEVPAEMADQETTRAETPDESEQEPQETSEKDVVEEPQAESVGDDKAETFVTAELQQASPPEPEKPAAADAGAKEVPAEMADHETTRAETPDESEQEPQETSEKDVVEEPQAESVGDDKAETFVTAELQQASQPEPEKPAAADDGAKEVPAEMADQETTRAETPDESEQEPQETPEKDVVEEPQAVMEIELKTEAGADEKPIKAPSEKDDDEDTDALTEKYGTMNRDSLVVTLEALVEEDDINHIRKHIGFIKVAYRKLLRDENLAAYEQKLSKDRDDQDEEETTDLLSERFEAAFNIYKEKKATWDKALEKEMQDNLAQKETILEELRQLIDSEEELKKTYDQFNDLQERWRSLGPVPRGAKSTLWNNYHFLVEKFFDKVNINKELKDLDLKKNLEAKTELCEKAEELFLETSITKSFQQLQKLHEAWKETGPVPKDKKDEIWDRFRFATEKLNKRRQDHYDKLREEQNKNYTAKLVLCDKAEELLTVIPQTPRQWQNKTNEINELFKVWKTIGFAPKKVNNEVWNRFRSALDAFFANKKEYFRKYKDQQRENYNQKLNLCLQAEALKDSEDWRSTTEALINLQNEWKKIGPVPAKFSDKIWKRFRQACDHFFNRKSEHFSSIGEQQTNNLNEKLALIEQIKKYKYTDDNKENLEILKDFQRKWMEIGHVPIKQKDKVQTEFRKAIDHQFDVLNISKKAKTTLSFRTKIENLKNVQNADNIIQKERNFITGKIKNLETDIKVLENNIGFFASSKKADLLKAEFEEKIEKARNEIGVLKEKMKILREV